MASKRSDQKSDRRNARVKLRWVELDVEGGTADFVEGLKSFAQALTRGGTSAAAPARALTAGRPTATAVIDSPLADESSPEEVRIPEREPETEVMPENGTGSSSEKPRKFPKPKFLSELDLTAAEVKLEDFFQQKNPQEMGDKYLVVIAWFDEHRKVTPITANHIFTAFKSLGIQSELPEDIGWPLRYLKKQNLIDSAGRGAFKIIWNGTQAVEKMGTPKS